MPSFHLSLFRKIAIVFASIFDRRTSGKAKIILLGGVLYGMLPLDLLPDIVPIIGFADDITIIIIVLLVFLRLTSPIRRILEKEKSLTVGDTHS